MAYILKINEWIIVTKTNAQPMYNQCKNNGKIEREDIVIK